MKSELRFKTRRKNMTGKPSIIITFEIDDARMWLEGSKVIREDLWNELDTRLASWEKQMHVHNAQEPIF